MDAEAAIDALTLLSRFLPWKPGAPRTREQCQKLQNSVRSWINALRQAFDEMLPKWPDMVSRKIGFCTPQAASHVELVDTVLPYVGNNISEASYIAAKVILKAKGGFKEVTEEQIANKANSIRVSYHRTIKKLETLKKRLCT